MRFQDRQLDIEITDTGAGMSAADQARIFEQGYSTKGTNQGSASISPSRQQKI